MLPSYSRQGSSPDGMVALALVAASLSTLPTEEQGRLLLQAKLRLPADRAIHAIEARRMIDEMLREI
jgi:hypothetical protein